MDDYVHFTNGSVKVLKSSNLPKLTINDCAALYRGYKKRGVELEAVSAALPPYLATTKTSIVVQDFKDVEDETTLRELHEYLFRKHNLIEKVIRARKLHHSHFFAIDNDYGHEKYLNQLQNEKHVIARALEKLGQRGTTVMYQQVIMYLRRILN